MKGEVKQIDGKKGKVRVELESRKGVDRLMKVEKEKWRKVVGRKVGEVRAMDVWVGMVIPEVELRVWKREVEGIEEGIRRTGGDEVDERPVLASGRE